MKTDISDSLANYDGILSQCGTSFEDAERLAIIMQSIPYVDVMQMSYIGGEPVDHSYYMVICKFDSSEISADDILDIIEKQEAIAKGC